MNFKIGPKFYIFEKLELEANSQFHLCVELELKSR
jgi:hypothetical protein